MAASKAWARGWAIVAALAFGMFVLHPAIAAARAFWRWC